MANNFILSIGIESISFIDHGWVWGGYFIQGVDYMHFGKLISTHYQINHLEVIPTNDSIPNLKQGIG
jgi:hypothetical protein